jgi:hypothetical protein
MPATLTKAPPGAADWSSKRGDAPGLHGIEGALRLMIQGAPQGLLKVSDGYVEIDADGDADVTVSFDTQQTMLEILAGSLHPIVARLQGRVLSDGDAQLALKVMLRLRAGSPWSDSPPTL